MRGRPLRRGNTRRRRYNADGLGDRIKEYIGPEICLPAIGQGAIGIECRKDDEFINKALSAFRTRKPGTAVVAERAFLRRLEGGCQVPIAAHAEVTDGGKKLRLGGLVGSVTGDRIIKD